MLIARSPVRISFGGGGTDLPAYFEQYGGAVLSAAINKYFYTILCKRRLNDGNIQVISSDLKACETWENIDEMAIGKSDLAIPLAALKQFERKPSIDMFFASEIPPGTGLGSSASVCVNVLRALSEYLNIPLSQYELAERAFNIAHTVLGKPVGKQDEYASAFGGLNYITFARDGSVTVEPLHLGPRVLDSLQSNLMLFFTGVSHNSWTILNSQEKSTRARTGLAIDSLHQIRCLADRMRAALQEGDLTAFGHMLDEGWQAKKGVSREISNSRIDELYALALENGAMGGKITGAGGGGFLLLYCEAAHQEKVRRAFAERDVREMAFSFDFDGARVIVNDPFVDGDQNCGLKWNFVPLSSSTAQFV